MLVADYKTFLSVELITKNQYKMKTAEEFLKEYIGKQQIIAWGDVHEVMKRFAKIKCKEQQELAKEHLFDVGQTVYLTSKEDMPYPTF